MHLDIFAIIDELVAKYKQSLPVGCGYEIRGTRVEYY
jgi:hypothetical protein